jgi:outer membrane lipoprotein-sorting protein
MNQQSTAGREDELPDDILQQAIASIEGEPVPCGPAPGLVAATLGALEGLAQSSSEPSPFVPRATIVKLSAIAAGLLVAMSLVAVLISAVELSSPAFGDVFSQALKQVREAHAMSYVQEMTIEGKQHPITTKEFVAEDGRRRSEMAGNTKIFDATGSVRLTLIEPTHTALVREANEDQGLNLGKMFLGWLQHLKELGDKPDKELGQKELDGKQVSGFVATQGKWTFTMWIDDATNQPVRIEYDSQVNSTPAHITMKDFQFQQNLNNALFSLDVPAEYAVYGRPEDGKIEPSVGLKLAWSRPGAWAGVATANSRPTVFALEQGGRVTELNDGGEEIATTTVDEGAGSIRAANLLVGQKPQLITFRVWQPTVEAYNTDGKLLWSSVHDPAGEEPWAVDDVTTADLNGDGLDEVIVGYSGGTGLHVLDSAGNLLWKKTDLGNVWHVAAGDMEDDARPEVLITSSAGKVGVFDAGGKHLRDIATGFYPHMVRVWQQTEVTKQRLEAAVAHRNALIRQAREQELQILLLEARKSKGSDEAAPVAEPLIEAEFAKDPTIADLATQLSNLKLSIDEQRALSRGTRFSVGTLRHKLAGLEEQLEARKADLQPDVVARLAGKDLHLSSTAGININATLSLLQAERNVLQENLAMANEELDKQLREFDKLDTDTADLSNQESQLEDLRAIIKRVGTQLSLWNLELEAEQRIKVMDKASRPHGSDATQRNLEIVFAGVAGFCLMLLVAALFPRRRWAPVIALALLLGSLVATAVWALLPIRYEAQALIKVGKGVPFIIQDVSNTDEGRDYEIYKKTQLQLLKSNFVLSRAARKPEMVNLATMKEHRDDPAGFLEGNLLVDYPGDAELMRVALKGKWRDELPVVVNAVVDSYMDEIVMGDKVGRLRQKDLLAQNYSANQEAFRQKSEKFKKLARELGASSSEGARMRKKLADQRLESLVANRNTLMQRVRDVQFQISMLKQRKSQKPAEASVVDPLFEAEYAKDPIVADLTRQIADVRSAIREQPAPPSLPNRSQGRLHAMLLQLGELEQKIEKRKAVLQPEIVAGLTGKETDQPAAKKADIDAMLPLLEAERDGLQQKLVTASEDISRQIRDLDKSASLLIVSGSGQRKVPLAALDSQGKTLWSLDISAAVANAATCAERPWLALSLRDGNVRVVDMAAGKEIAHLGDQGGGAGVAWLPVDEGAPLLVIATDGQLQAFRVTTDKP